MKSLGLHSIRKTLVRIIINWNEPMVSQGTQGVWFITMEKFKQPQMMLSIQDNGKVVKLIRWRQVRSQVVETSNETKRTKGLT